MAVLRTLLLAVTLLAAPLAAHAQRADRVSLGLGRIVGIVVDAATKLPIEGVLVTLPDLDRPPQITDPLGRFTFDRLEGAVHLLNIEHIGYGRGGYLINVPTGETVDFRASLRPGAIALDSLVITADISVSRLAKVGFLERQKRGFGHFFRDEPSGSWRISEILRRVPRVDVVQGSGFARRVIIRSARGACVPSIYVDGMNQRWAEGDVEAVVGAMEIAAIEVYRGLDTPPIFIDAAFFRPCGAIVIWSKR